MVAARIIACLDVKDGRVVKGTQFVSLRDQGDPVELAAHYDKQGIDELVFLDISATNEQRNARLNWVHAVAEQLSIPFTVGGGVGDPADVRALLRAGADKVAINSAAVKRPELLRECAEQFGAQCVVCAIDAKATHEGYRVFTHGGKTATDLDVEQWALRATELGAGELLVTSIDRDGTKSGFDDVLLKRLSTLRVPVIASGGAGTMEHFHTALTSGASAVLAASLFHEKVLDVQVLKSYLHSQGHSIRISHP